MHMIKDKCDECMSKMRKIGVLGGVSGSGHSLLGLLPPPCPDEFILDTVNGCRYDYRITGERPVCSDELAVNCIHEYNLRHLYRLFMHTNRAVDEYSCSIHRKRQRERGFLRRHTDERYLRRSWHENWQFLPGALP